MPHDNLKTIYVSPATHETLRRLAFEANCSMGDIVASLLDPRTPEQRERAYDAATLDPEVLK